MDGKRGGIYIHQPLSYIARSLGVPECTCLRAAPYRIHPNAERSLERSMLEVEGITLFGPATAELDSRESAS